MAMPHHFRCLKDAISAQLKHNCELLSEKDVGPSGVTKGETLVLKMLEQSLRQQREFHQMGMMEPEAWRPQRGLPEHSVKFCCEDCGSKVVVCLGDERSVVNCRGDRSGVRQHTGVTDIHMYEIVEQISDGFWCDTVWIICGHVQEDYRLDLDSLGLMQYAILVSDSCVIIDLAFSCVDSGLDSSLPAFFPFIPLSSSEGRVEKGKLRAGVRR
ncbi:hypothetical protein Tco_1555927 [Tanacetum coccineum]